MIKTSTVFHIADSADKVICPPDQVFRNENFEFLFAPGGHLVEDDKQYDELMRLLNEIGETRFTVKENFGATITERKVPFEISVPVNSNFKEFKNQIRNIDENMMISHWFVHGQCNSWGIYISEFPLINIIGCISDIAEKFRRAFQIEGNGYELSKEFILSDLELLKDHDAKRIFFENYKIETHHKGKLNQ